MPYIKQNYRSIVEEAGADNPGELNYLITMNCLDYLSTTNQKYEDFNAVIGALECAKLEMYRRMIAPYEDNKKEENGDVYS